MELDRIKKERAETGSANAKPKPKAKPTGKPELEPDVNPQYRSSKNTPPELSLPTGLNHSSRATRWRERIIEIRSELFGKKNGKGLEEGEAPMTPEQIEAFVDKSLKNRQDAIYKGSKNKDGTHKYTKEEALGLAARELAKEEEAAFSLVRVKKEKIKSTKDTEWGNAREEKWGKENVDNHDVVRGLDTFDYIYRQFAEKLKKPTPKQYLKAGAIGAGVGYFIADEDKTLGGLMGLVGGLLFRGNVKGINLSKAKIKARVYNVADESIGIQKALEIQAGKTLNVLHRVLKGKDASLSELDFLAYVEDYSKPPSASKFGKEGRLKGC